MKLYLAIPTHSYSICVETAITLLDVTAKLTQRGSGVHTCFHSASMISHLRNTIVADFLASDCTHLLMIDSDQGIPVDVLMRLIDSEYLLAGVIYPRRNFAWHQYDPSRSVSSIQDVINQGLRFVGNVLPDPDGQLTVLNGFARAQNIGGGVMLIARATLDRLISSYPELHGTGFPDEDENETRAVHNWGFFNPPVKSTDGINAGEDVGFCKLWTDIGGEIWADIVSDTVHVGRYPFRGNYWTHMHSTGSLTST
jgi:hypothetical protein